MTEALIATAIVALGALVQASIGIGFSLVAVPVLLLLDPVYVPGPMLVNSIALTAGTALREHTHIDLHGLGSAFTGRVLGTALGAGALLLLPERELTLGMGGLILLAVALSVLDLHPVRTRAVLAGAGTLSGFMGTTSTIAGPPLALAYQAEAGPRLRSTLAANLLFGAVLSLIAVTAVGRFGLAELRAAGVLLPGLALGFALSGPAKGRLDTGYTRAAVLGVAAVGGLAVIARAL